MRDLSDLVKSVRAHASAAKVAQDALAGISRADTDREGRLPALTKHCDALAKSIAQIEARHIDIGELQTWLDSYREELSIVKRRKDQTFGAELAAALKPMSLLVTGQHPELRVGLLLLVVDSDSQTADIWYGPRMQKIASCPLAASAVSETMEKAVASLGSRVDENDLVNAVSRAYARKRLESDDVQIPIRRMLSEVSFLLQDSKFHALPVRGRLADYTPADFSYDMFKHRSALRQAGMQLKGATRASTRRASDFIWIPDSADGKGATYTHMSFAR